MRIGIALDYSGGFHEAVDRVVELEKAGIDIAVVAEAYSYDADQPARVSGRQDQHRRIGLGGISHLHPHAVAAGDDRRGPGLRVRRPIPPRHRHVRAPGDRGVSRRRVRRADRPHPRDRGDLPAGVAPGTGAIRRQALSGPAARGSRNGFGQASAAHQSSCARTHSDIDRGAGPEERRAHRRDRRGLAAGLLPSGEGRLGVGRGAGRRRRQAGSGAGAAGRDGARVAGHRRRRRRSAGLGQAETGVSTSAEWAPRAATSTTTWRLATGSARSRTGSRSCICPAASGRPIDVVPDELVRGMSLVGPRGFIAERLAAFAEAGVTTMLVSPVAPTRPKPCATSRKCSSCGPPDSLTALPAEARPRRSRTGLIRRTAAGGRSRRAVAAGRRRVNRRRRMRPAPRVSPRWRRLTSRRRWPQLTARPPAGLLVASLRLVGVLASAVSVPARFPASSAWSAWSFGWKGSSGSSASSASMDP